MPPRQRREDQWGRTPLWGQGAKPFAVLPLLDDDCVIDKYGAYEKWRFQLLGIPCKPPYISVEKYMLVRFPIGYKQHYTIENMTSYGKASPTNVKQIMKRKAKERKKTEIADLHLGSML
nr:hypothetical protein [Tanacetum cinerariifolium]